MYRLAVDGVRRGMGVEAASLVIRRSLQGFRPFEMLCERLALGEGAQVAIRKTALLLGIEETGLDVLLRWGDDLGILEYGENGAQLVPELQPSANGAVPILSSGDLESEAKARLYNARILGRDANNRLDETDRELLASALLTHDANPRKSVENSGQALEDFLREVADDKGLGAEAAKANGIEQLATLLYSKSVIHGHHQKLTAGVSAARNATAHRKDKKTMTPWAFTPLGAFAIQSTTLAVIRSIHDYTTTGRQVL